VSRQGVTPLFERFFSGHLWAHTLPVRVDVYEVMRPAGQVERLLGLDQDRWWPHW